MTMYRVVGRDFGEPSLPDAALAGFTYGDVADLTLDPAVEAVLIDAGLIELVVPPASAGSILVPFTVPGVLAVGAGQAPFDMQTPAEILGIQASVALGHEPTGQAIIADVNYNGTTLFTTQAGRPMILPGERTSGIVVPDVTTLALPGYLTTDVDQVGNGLVFVDSFVGTPNTNLTAHTVSGGSGGPWVKHTSYGSGVMEIDDAGTGLMMVAQPAVYYPSGLTPSSADYRVSGVLRCKSLAASSFSSLLMGRMSIASSNASGYGVIFQADATTDGAGTWQLYQIDAPGSGAIIGSYHEAAGAWSVNGTRTVDLEMTGTTIKVSIGGTERISVTDAVVTQVGKPGLYTFQTGAQSTGYHWSGLSVLDSGAGEPGSDLVVVVRAVEV